MRFNTLFACCRTWSFLAVLFIFGALSGNICEAYNWETAVVNGRDCVTLRSFCGFYRLSYSEPHSNLFVTTNGVHTVGMQLGSAVISIDGVHYTLSFPIEGGDHDWLVSRMDVIKLFEPLFRPEEIANRHAVRGVVIDPGHGGTDNGASNSRGMEKNYTLDTAFRLERILKDQGLNVVLTRRTDEFIELYERARIAAQYYPNYIFVSIHYNCATPEARGLETYCVTPVGSASTSSAYLSRSDGQRLLGNADDPQNILLASCVQSEIIHLNPGDSTADRGVKRARFVVIKQNVLPAILVEGGFVSNRGEAALINTEDYREKLAQAIARGVEKYESLTGSGGHHFSFFGSGNEASNNGPALPPPTVSTAPPTPAVATKPPVMKSSAIAKNGKNPAPVVDSKPGAATNLASTTSTAKSRKSKRHGSTLASSPANPLLNVKPTGTPQLISRNDQPSPSVQLYSGNSVPQDSSNQVPVSTMPPGSSKGAPLNLSEPTPPPAGKDAPNSTEPDEPPVQIYQGQPSGK